MSSAKPAAGAPPIHHPQRGEILRTAATPPCSPSGSGSSSARGMTQRRRSAPVPSRRPRAGARRLGIRGEPELQRLAWPDTRNRRVEL